MNTEHLIPNTTLNQNKTNKIIEKFLEEYTIFAPVKSGERVLISKISEPKEIYWGSEMPEYSWKKFFIPSKEEIFKYNKSEILPPKDLVPRASKDEIKAKKKTMLLGINVLDLRALTFLSQVFEKDPHVQARLKRTIIIGSNAIPGNADFNVFHEKYEDSILECLIFDAFIENQEGTFRFFTGSEDGQRLLDRNGVEKYDNIQYVGYKKEPEKRELRDAIVASKDDKLWEELGQICLECGKCTLVCPTCYCYRMHDESGPKPGKGKRMREWSACFYKEFTEISGGKHSFLNDTKDRIYFWYHHKFVRDFDQYGMPGCVGCGRCSKTCPVEIKLNETLDKAQGDKSKTNNPKPITDSEAV